MSSLSKKTNIMVVADKSHGYKEKKSVAVVAIVATVLICTNLMIKKYIYINIYII